MIYRDDVPLDEWLEKHPDLDVCSVRCIDCGRTIKADRPYINADYVGLTSRDCICGSKRSGCSSSIAISELEIESWSSVMDC
jgi:hypothetical protein